MRVSPHPLPIGALHHRRPRAGPDCGQLREEPAVTGLDGSFATSPGSSDRIARQDRFGPPPPIQGASAYPGLDRPVSGLATVTPGAFTPGPSPLRAAGFSLSLRLRNLNLATVANSLARDSRRTTRPRLPSLEKDLAILPFGKEHRFRAVSTCRHPVSGSFHPPPGVLFSFPSRYCVRYRSRNVFRVGGWYPQLPAPYSRHGTQDPSPRILHPCAYGAFTLYGPPFQASSASGARNWRRSYNPTSPVGFPTRFGLPSPLFPRRY